jgi:RND family efflux transporter MFP subunit
MTSRWRATISARTSRWPDTAETAAVQAASELESARLALEDLETRELALDVKRADLVLARSQAESDQIALTDATERLADTRVRAPLDGVVAERNVEAGQIITSGIATVGGGTTVFTVSDLSRLFIEAAVDESDIGKVRVGQEATVTADAFPGREFRGRVVRIATRGTNVSNVVSFGVRIEILDGPAPESGGPKADGAQLKPEMTANVEIVAARRESALVVPAEAVVRRRGESLVEVVRDDGTAEMRRVEAGITDGILVEMTGGLAEGETVYADAGGGVSRWRRGGGRGFSLFGRRRRSNSEGGDR